MKFFLRTAPLKKEVLQDVIRQEGAKLNAVPSFKGSYAAKNPFLFKGVQVKVPGLLQRHAVDFHREIVNILAILVLKTSSRHLTGGSTGTHQFENVHRLSTHRLTSMAIA